MKVATVVAMVLVATGLAYALILAAGHQPVFPSFCPVPKGLYDPSWIKADDPPLPCWEFWLNRYQTGLAALLAFGAAFMTLLPVRAQMKESARQSAAAARNSVVETGRDLEAEVDALEKSDEIRQNIVELLRLYDEEELEEIYEFWSTRCWERIDEIEDFSRALAVSHLRAVGSVELMGIRSRLLDTSRRFKVALSVLNRAFRHSFAQFDPDGVEIEMTDEEITDARIRVRTIFNEWILLRKELGAAMEIELAATWARARRLENRSMPG